MVQGLSVKGLLDQALRKALTAKDTKVHERNTCANEFLRDTSRPSWLMLFDSSSTDALVETDMIHALNRP
jgi:hypothetical protein